jgi:hypothetical protein
MDDDPQTHPISTDAESTHGKVRNSTGKQIQLLFNGYSKAADDVHALVQSSSFATDGELRLLFLNQM